MYSRPPPRQDQNLVAFRPENALRRANDLKKIGNVRAACEALHEVLMSRKMGRYWNKHHEDMMIEFIDLCTELRETRRTRDGLYFYRQLTQLQNPASLEKVVHHMIDSALRKASDAKRRADVDLDKLALMDDLDDEEESPEALLMGAVSSDGARERAEREVLVPWLRHAWDTFRNVLENIRYVPRLEALYHATVVKTMGFCQSFNRVSEFRRLCGMLKLHLQAQRRSQEANGVVMTPEQIERHLTTRFTVLEYCADLVQWTEAFRTIEEINFIMSLSDAAPKSHLMAMYYDKLGRIFWVSENYLFHAFAVFKHYHLSVAHNKLLTEEERRNMASAVVLATLAIPVYSAGPGSSAAYGGAGGGGAAEALEVDAGEREKKSKLAALLKHPSIPSRESLIAEMTAKGVLKAARPDIATLFRTVEGEFAPLSLIARAAPILTKLRADASSPLAVYAPNLERLAVFRTLQQLSQVYSTFSLPAFDGLLAGLSLSRYDVEKLIVRAVKNRLLMVRVDHREATLRFGHSRMESMAMRKQLTSLAAGLSAVALAIQQVHAGGVGAATAVVAASAHAARAAASSTATVPDHVASLFQAAREQMGGALRAAAERKDIIERRKEDAERARQKAEREATAAKKREEAARLEANLAQQREEEKRREKLRYEEEQARQHLDRVRKMMEMLGRDVGTLDTLTVKSINVAALEAEMEDKLRKASEEEGKRKAEQGRRLDFLVRALREAERAKVAALAKVAYEEHAAVVAEHNTKTLPAELARHDAALAAKPTLSKIRGTVTALETKLLAPHKAEWQSRVDKVYTEYLKRKVARARERQVEAAKKKAEEAAKRAADAEARRKAEESELMRASYATVSEAARDAASGVASIARRPPPADRPESWHQARAEFQAAREGGDGGWRDRMGGGGDRAPAAESPAGMAETWRARGAPSAPEPAPTPATGGDGGVERRPAAARFVPNEAAASGWRARVAGSAAPTAAPPITPVAAPAPEAPTPAPATFSAPTWRERQAAARAAGGDGGGGGGFARSEAPAPTPAPTGDDGAGGGSSWLARRRAMKASGGAS